MKSIDTNYLLQNYPKYFTALSFNQTSSLSYLINKFSTSEVFDTKAKISYTLATVKHETADSFAPIKERGSWNYFKYLIGKLEIKDIIEANKFKGRGYVQITGKTNYRKFSELLGIDLLNEPDLALLSENAFKIMELGLDKGYFTGKKLNDYFNGDTYNFGIRIINGKKISPRQIINGFDRAELIGNYADKFFELVKFV